jgi:hypothetical protein
MKIENEPATEPASACDAAAQAAYEYFRVMNGDNYLIRWEHLSEEAQSLWRTLATRTHDAWEAAAGR